MEKVFHNMWRNSSIICGIPLPHYVEEIICHYVWISSSRTSCLFFVNLQIAISNNSACRLDGEQWWGERVNVEFFVRSHMERLIFRLLWIGDRSECEMKSIKVNTGFCRMG